MKAKHANLLSEKEDLQTQVSKLREEIEEHKARAKLVEKRSQESKKQDSSAVGSEDKEKIFNELLLSTARNKTRLLEKLREIFDEFSKVKSKLDEELESQGKGSTLEKISQELSESVMHTERFIQSIAHDRPVTVVADSADEKDPGFELAKENEELIGRISAIQSSRRRESTTFKEELTKMKKDKVEAVKAKETKYKEEVEKLKKEFEEKIKEKDQAAAEVRNSLKQEVSQLKLDIRRMTDEHELEQRTARTEAWVASKKMEEEIKLLQDEMENKLADKESELVKIKRKADADAKENAQMSEREISQVRANWADAERKLRIASEQKNDAIRELERVRQDRTDAQKQASQREDGLKKERERLQIKISNLESQIRNGELSGMERTQTKINELQRSLEDLTVKNQQLETARRNSEQNLGPENERLRYENSRLQRELRERSQQRRINEANDGLQRRPDPNVSSRDPVKVMSTVRQTSVEKARVPLESAAGPFTRPQGPMLTNQGPYPGYQGSRPGTRGPASAPQVPVTDAQGAYPPSRGPISGTQGPSLGDPQRRAVTVREGQTTSVHVTRAKEQAARRNSEQRNSASDELGGSSVTVVRARPREARVPAYPQPQKPQPEWKPQQDMDARAQAFSQPQKPQPEWKPKQNTNTWPMQKDPPKYPSNNIRQPQSTRAQPSTQKNGHYNEDSRQRPGYQNSQPITRQHQDSLETEVRPYEVRRPPEVVKLQSKDQPRSTISHRARRPSIGSDDVFVASSFDANQNLTSHGSKNGDFYRSRSLEDLLVSDHQSTKQSENNAVRGHNPKLPKSFSGPRKGAAKHIVHPGRGIGNRTGAKTVTQFKVLQNVSFNKS